MKTNPEILNDVAAKSNKMLDAMELAQLEILEELEKRFDELNGEVDVWDLLYELKEELNPEL